MSLQLSVHGNIYGRKYTRWLIWVIGVGGGGAEGVGAGSGFQTGKGGGK